MDYKKEIEMIEKQFLNEAGLDYGHKGEGEIKFEKTDGSEFHIQKILEDFAKAKNISKGEAQKYYNAKVDEMIKNMEKSPKLNGTMMQNAGESVAFDMIEEIPMDDVKFDKRVFQDLFNFVKAEVPEFYPLSNVFETKRIEPTLAYTPDPLTPEYASVTTAACTPTAVLIFNVSFMEKLMKYASVKGIQANKTKLHGKKYVSQGGDIPDEYQYAEFVLLHEIMHYANGDFYFEKAYNLDGQLVNYVGDFITNYNLVKSGYAQLPIGLFNDEINYDRYNTYQQMYDVVEEEMKNLSDQDEQNMRDQMDQMGDDMPEKGEGQDPNDQQQQNGQQNQNGQDQQQQDGQEGQGDGQPQDGQDGQQGGGSGDGQESGEDGDKDGEGDGGSKTDKDSDNKDAKGAGGVKDDKEAEERAKNQKAKEDAGQTSGTNTNDGKQKKQVPGSIDDVMKGNGEMLEKGQADASAEVQKRSVDSTNAGAIADMMSGANNGTGLNSADGNPYAMPERQYKPKLDWKKMIKKMVPSGSVQTETYAKPSRRTTSSMVSVAQTGAGVVKPGMKEIDSDQKGLCFVLDNSGSTMGAIGEMQNDIMNLVKKHAKDLSGFMYVLKFSNDVHYFKVDVKKKKYGRITDIQDFIKTGRSDAKCDKPMASLFKSTYGGGTELTSKVTNAIKTMKLKLNFNTILFSDTDIAYGENAKTLKSIYKIMGPKSFALIGCDKHDYKAFVDLLGDKKNITHL